MESIVELSLGGDGPYTAKDVVINLHPPFRKAGARFESFGIINGKAEPGGTLAIYVLLSVPPCAAFTYYGYLQRQY